MLRAGSEATGGVTSAGGSGGSVAGTSGAGGSASGAGGAAGATSGGSGGTGGAGAGGGSGSGGSGSPATFEIHFDYRFDTLNTFTAERRAALAEAVRIWQDLILDEFDDVPAGTELRARNPEQIDLEPTIFTIDEPIDDLRLFTAFGTIDGPSGFMARAATSATNAVVDEELWLALMARYDGNPHQPWVGAIGFDVAEDWFFDATPATADDIPIDSSDFLTSALHEIGHTLGIGSSPAFDALIVNNQFTGARAVAVYGGPVPLHSDASHIDLSVLSDGQPCLMDPTSVRGTRKLPTTLDLAILQDIGYHIREN